MPPERFSDVKFEIGHVLFIDIVGYAKLLITEQSDRLQALKQIVRSTEQFRLADAAGKLLRLPTGDGAALVFRTSPEAPVLCALEISKALKNYPELPVRMGIHSGPVNEIADLNEQANIAGAGINMAQRVMDCGDAGHILLSKHVAEDLEQYPQWRPYLRELGECEVKHGVRIHTFNLHRDGLGNPATPTKFKKAQRISRAKRTKSLVALLLLASVIGLAIVATIFRPAILRGPVPAPNETATRAIPEKSIAVLPFANLSDDKANAYFADGIQDEILTKLSRIADLKVISRTSTAKYKSKPEDLRTVAQQLGVAHILEGAVQRTADKVHVNVQLIDAGADAHLWAESYDRKLKDVFAVESEVSQKIANALQARLSSAETNRLTSTPTQDPEAYDLFLKGEYASHQADVLLKAEPFDRAAAFYEQALARDPNFALAGARLVVSRVRRHFFISQLSAPELDEIKKLADQTVFSAPNLPETHIALGTYYYLGQRQYDHALKELQRALELQPNNIGALELTAYLHRRQGQWQLGLSEMEKCEERDPRNPALVANIAGAYCSLRMWKEARRTGLRALAIDPQSIVGLQSAIFASLNGSGDVEAAKHTLADYPQPGRIADFSVTASARPQLYLKLIERDFAGALKLCETEIDDPAENRARLATHAAIHVLAGDAARVQNEIARTRDLLESRLRERPDDAPALLQLGWVNLALQRNAEAVRLARHAAELVPVEKDALLGPTYLACLAEIEARTGDASAAVKTLRRLLSMPIGFYISIQQLKIDPVWDPIRPNPGFQQLLAGKEQIGASFAPKE
jgi:TolB-like protein/class 3 adenylate cyclase